jgi:hypothetical protein
MLQVVTEVVASPGVLTGPASLPRTRRDPSQTPPMGAKEEARRCQKCGNQWWAQRVKKQATLRWYDDGASFTGSSTARSVRLAHRKTEQIREWERYGLCSRCGSRDVKSVSDRGFVPTGLAENSSQLHVPSVDPQPAPRVPGFGFQPGDRVVLKQLGYRGLTGTVEGKGVTGYKVRLDRDNRLVRSLPENKLAAIASRSA